MAWAEIYAALRVDSSQVQRDVQRGVDQVDTSKAGQRAGDRFGGEFSKTSMPQVQAAAGKFTTLLEGAGRDAGRKAGAAISTEISRTLASLKSQAATMRATLDVDDKAGLAKVTGFQARLEALSRQVASPRIDMAGVARVQAQLAAIDAAMHKAGESAQESRGGFAALAGEITGFGAAAQAASGRGVTFTRVLAGLNLATGLLEPVMAGLVVAAGASGSAFAAAGLGVAGFAAGAAAAISQVTDSVKAYTAAVDAAAVSTAASARGQQIALAGLDSSQRQIVTSISAARDAWQDFGRAASPAVARALADAVGLLPRAFQVLRPFTDAAAGALQGFTGQVAAAITPGARFSSTLGELAAASGPILRGALTSAFNVVQGLAGVLRAFIPEGMTFTRWVEDATARFREWGMTLSDHSGFQSLMAMFREQTPVAAEILRNLGDVIRNIISAMAGLATGANSRALLLMLQPISAVLKELSGNRVLMDIALYLVAIHSAASKLGPVLETVHRGFTLLASGDLAVKFTQLSSSVTGIAASVARIAASPWTWAAAAAVGVGVLVWHLLSARDAVDAYFAELQKAAQSAPLLNLQATLALQVSAAQKDLAAATARTAAAQASWGEGLNRGAGGLANYNENLARSRGHQAAYAAGLTQIRAEQDLVNTRIGQAAGVFGSASAAWAMLNAAGVTSGQVLDKNNATWTRALTAAQAYDSALKDSVGTGGRYAAAQNAMAVAAGSAAGKFTENYAAVTKVTQAEGQLLSVLLSGEQAFTGFQQNIGQIAKQAADAGGAIGRLDADSLALAGSYYGTVVPGLQKLSDSMQQMGARTDQLRTVLATGAGEVLRFAGSSDAARSVVVALINNALGPGTVSLQNLDKWVGQNSTSLAGMSRVVDQVTGNASKLAGVLKDNLNQMLAESAARALGGQRAFDQLGAAIAAGNTRAQDLVANGGQKVLSMLLQMSGNSVPAAQRAFRDWAVNGLGVSDSKANELWDTLTRQRLDAVAGKAGTSKAAFDRLSSSLGVSRQRADDLWNAVNRLPASKTVTITMRGDGTFKVGTTGLVGQAAGGPVTAGTTSVADDVLIRVSRGEWIVKAASAAKYGDKAMAAVNEGRAIIGYAGGGQVRGYASGGAVYTTSNLTGAWVTSMYARFEEAFTAAMVAAMRAAIKAAEAAAAKAAAAAPGGGGSNAANIALAQKMAAARGWTGSQWTALYNLIMGESGGSSTVVNPSSGAAGIAQNISGFGPGYERGNAGQQIAWMLDYIAGRYGTPAAAWAFWQAQSPHWYRAGTRGARPGWGWVGEEGPELVRFRGGETVLDAALSRAAARGLGGDDGAQVLALLQRLIDVTAQVPARTGQHVTAGLNTTAAGAAFRVRYPSGGI